MKSTAPKDQLKAEHEKIIVLLGILQGICAELEAKEDINLLYLEQVNEFMKIFVDKFHHGKEKDLLFQRCGKPGFVENQAPLAN